VWLYMIEVLRGYWGCVRGVVGCVMLICLLLMMVLVLVDVG